MKHSDKTPYDIFKHGAKQRVIDSFGRVGFVAYIRETGNEWISPFIIWDNKSIEEKYDGPLWLLEGVFKG